VTRPLVTRTAHGLYVPAAALHLDARDAPGTVFVSHAHSDHATRAARILCTPETAALHERRRGPRETVAVPFHAPTRVGDAEVTLVPAGHALGSAMIVAESAAGRVAYTGDYKLRPNPFSPPAAVPRVDELVMECTFGEPRYVFPPDDVLVKRLYRFVDEAFDDDAVPVVLAYALGKGRRRSGTSRGTATTWCCTGPSPTCARCTSGSATSSRAGDVGALRARQGGAARAAHRAQHAQDGDGAEARAQAHACCSPAWALHPGAWNIYKDLDLVLPISDHADFDELVRTATESGARKVWTVHGHAGFAAHLRGLGIDRGEHPAEHPQTAAMRRATPACRTPTRVRPASASPSDARSAARRGPTFHPRRPARFAEWCVRRRPRCAPTTKRLEKSAALERYFRDARTTRRSAIRRTFFSGLPFRGTTSGRRASAGRRRGRRAGPAVTERVARAAPRAHGGRRRLGRRRTARVRSATAARPRRAAEPRRGLGAFDEIAATRGAHAKRDRVRALLATLGPIEAQYAVKLLLGSGELRIGLKEARWRRRWPAPSATRSPWCATPTCSRRRGRGGPAGA
jgi:hypothetical protein